MFHRSFNIVTHLLWALKVNHLTVSPQSTGHQGYASIELRPQMIWLTESLQIFMQGNLDNDGQLIAKANYQWGSGFVTKCQTQIAPGQGQAMMHIDNEITGKDFTASLKTINPSLIEGSLTGILVGSYLQSITPSLAVGFETMWQRMAMNSGPETTLSYVARYKGSDWVASAQLLQAQSAINTSYWRRLTDKVEAGVDLNLQFTPGMGGGGLMGGGLRKEGITTVGAKYDFRTSTFRAQLDSSGRLSCLLEKRVLPPVQITFAGEMDHFKVCWSDRSG